MIISILRAAVRQVHLKRIRIPGKVLFLGLLYLSIVLTINPLAANQKQNFRVALTGKYPPFNFYSEKGALVGFDVDVARKIADYLNQDLQLITTEWSGILAGLLVDKYDAIIGSMAITPSRKQKVNFSQPYYISGAQLFIQASKRNKYHNIRDLKGKKVGVGIGETYEAYLEENYPEIKIVPYKSTPDIFQDMRNNRIQGFVTDSLVGLYQIKKAEMDLIPCGELLYTEKMAIPVKMEDTRLLSQINRALTHLKSSGELQAIYNKWFDQPEAEAESAPPAMQSPVIVKKLVKGFSITLLVAFCAILLGFALSIPFGIILNKRDLFIYYFVRTLNDLIRGTPLLIQLFFVYFGAPQIGITLTPIQAAIFTLTINASAYMAEVIRSGLMSVDYGQTLAGRSLGLTKLQTFLYIIWPQAFRIALPPLMNAVVALIKDTALIAIISVSEVIREAQSIISVTYNPIKYYFIVALMFFIFTFPLMKLSDKLELKIKAKGFQR